MCIRFACVVFIPVFEFRAHPHSTPGCSAIRHYASQTADEWSFQRFPDRENCILFRQAILRAIKVYTKRVYDGIQLTKTFICFLFPSGDRKSDKQHNFLSYSFGHEGAKSMRSIQSQGCKVEPGIKVRSGNLGFSFLQRPELEHFGFRT